MTVPSDSSTSTAIAGPVTRSRVWASIKPAAFPERGARSVITFDDHQRVDWPRALAGLVDRGRFRTLEIAEVDGEPVTGTDHAERLAAAGFVPATEA